MNIKEKIKLDYHGLIKHGPINIVAFGDSVTHGCVGDGEINYETVYWNRLKNKILEVSNYVPVNTVNAGIGGITSWDSLERMDSQVFSHRPDLVIICFGLNDVNGGLDDYLGAMGKIFDRCKAENTDAIFLTPNMLNTYVADNTLEELKEYAAKTAEMQMSGRMDRYIYAAAGLAKEKGIPVCDCYSEWKKLAETQDTTMLLANRINHPTREMHELFAQSLFNMIFEGTEYAGNKESTMFSEDR